MMWTDWLSIATNSFWIAGLALLLSSASWAWWRARTAGHGLRIALTAPAVQCWLWLGLSLVCLGLLLSVRSVPERVVWLGFGLWFGASSALVGRRAALTAPAPAQRRSGSGTAGQREFAGRLDAAARVVVRAEPWLLLALAPLLLLPTRMTPWLAPLLLIPWVARRITERRFTASTALDAPLILLLAMVAVSMWASLELQRSMPKFWGILFGVAVFFAIVNHVRTPAQAQRAGFALALFAVASSLAAALTMHLGSSGSLTAVPFQELTADIAERGGSLSGGLHPNEVGGMLTLFIPYLASLVTLGLSPPKHDGADPVVPDGGWTEPWPGSRLWPAMLAMGLVLMSIALFATRSASALLGTACALLCVAGFRRRWFWPSVCLLLVVATVALHVAGPSQVFDSFLAITGVRNIRARLELWQRALYMIRDFPYTGVGLNMFSMTANSLYPLFTIPPDRVLQLTHAHSVLLQVAVDLGLPGLVAYLALLMGFVALWRSAYRRVSAHPLRAMLIGLLCGMVAYHVYGLTDCWTLGAKPGVAIWAMWGLTAAVANLSFLDADGRATMPDDAHPEAFRAQASEESTSAT